MNDTLRKGAILITGTSTGIGQASALHLDQLGYAVFATVRKESDAERLKSMASPMLQTVLMDVTKSDEIERARDQVQQVVGEQGLYGLVNNAGYGITGPLEFFPLEQMRKLYEVHTFGVLGVTQAFLPLLRQAKGRIANVSSTATLVVAPFHGPYSSAKSAMNTLTNSIRLELIPHKVHVSLVICGSVNTPIWTKGGELTDQTTEGYPPEADQLYGAKFNQLDEFFSNMGDEGVSPQVAAKKIAKVFTSKNPRNTYFIGPDAHVFNILDKIFYGKLRDWLILRVIGLN